MNKRYSGQSRYGNRYNRNGRGTGRHARRTGGTDKIKIYAVLIGAVLVLIALIWGMVAAVRGCVGGGRTTDVVQPVAVPAATQTTSVQTQAAALPSAEPVATEEPVVADVPADTTQAPAAESAPKTGLRSATIRSIGDFVIHEPLFNTALKLGDGGDHKYDFAPFLSEISEIMGNADYTIANVDGPMGGPGKRGYKGYPQFNTPPYLLYALKDAGVDMLTLSNNHALDTYFDGLKAEIANLITVDMDYVGGARTQEEHDTPVVRDINGIKVGFLDYTTSANTMEQYSDKEASIYGINFAKTADFAADAAAARSAGAEVVIAYMHWGTEYEREPDSDQQYYAKKLVAAGVDVIIGSHPHVVQKAYWLTGTTASGQAQTTLCLCSLGNFLSDQRMQYCDGGIMFDFTIQEKESGGFEIVSPKYVPIWVWRTGNDAEGYMYKVLASGQYLDSQPDGMSSADYARMKEAYQETVSWMGTDVAQVSAR